MTAVTERATPRNRFDTVWDDLWRNGALRVWSRTDPVCGTTHGGGCPLHQRVSPAPGVRFLVWPRPSIGRATEVNEGPSVDVARSVHQGEWSLRAGRVGRRRGRDRRTTSEKAMHFFTDGEFVRMSLELSLGIGIKLFCDNGRIHWRDFVNDFLFWLPGVRARTCDGLGVQVEAMIPAVETETETETQLPLAAK